MPEEAGAWVRANAWTKALGKIEDAYPHGFHRWCSCEAGTCHPCRTGHHNQCISAGGPRVDDHAAITDRRGFVVAVIRYGPGQRPCRWICPCAHAPDGGAGAADTVDVAEVRSTTRRAATRCSKSVSPPHRQLSLFAGAGLPEEATDGETP
ncbi:hypothetical protein BIV25_10940 [Streptomyces sp. MUSC 14]|nr:hypothetical protein BIV25_10940 [Streptomyces sp. MUSC 14]